MPSARSLTTVALAATALTLAGCNFEGGRWYSSDSYTYVSRTWSPKTVTLEDTRTGETLWSVDLPVGKQMTVGFRKGTGPNEYKPDMMYWGLTEPGRIGRISKNWIPVPPHHGRKLELTLRDTPESPGVTMPGSPFEPRVDNYTASTAYIEYQTTKRPLYPEFESKQQDVEEWSEPLQIIDEEDAPEWIEPEADPAQDTPVGDYTEDWSEEPAAE